MSLNVLTQGGGGKGAFASIFVTGLSETDTVTATKDGKTVQGKWVQKVNPAYIGLPNGFTPLTHIEGTGTQCIDTVYKPNTNTRIEIGASSTDTTNDKPLFGVRKSGSDSAFVCWFNPQDSGAPTPAFGSTGNVSSGFGLSTGVQHDVTLQNGLFTMDGKTLSLTMNSFTSSYNLILFGLSNSGSIDSRKFYGKVYYTRLYDNGVLVRNFVPANRNSDNAVGMYDLVNGVFYTNAGTGTFIAGAEVPQYIYGHEISKIKSYGMWTVTATNGEDTTEQDVLVDAAVEFEIPMDYKLWLYREGDECEDVTGGWEVYEIFSGTNRIGAKTNNVISTAGYKTLHVQMNLGGTNSLGRYSIQMRDVSDRLVWGDDYVDHEKGNYTAIYNIPENIEGKLTVGVNGGLEDYTASSFVTINDVEITVSFVDGNRLTVYQNIWLE